MEKAVYRIIDANFNRAREAVRVIEEYCRFWLNSESLTGRAKQLRHELCTAVGRLEAGRLISGRDTAGDVGTHISVDNQMQRGSLKDSFTAAAKRLTEALRVLAEVIFPLNSDVSGEIERLRYRAYTLEKEVTLWGDSKAGYSGVRLYVVITSNLPAEIFSLAQKCIEGGADCIQLRAKQIEDDKLFAVAEEFVKICKAGGVLSIINDRVDIAVAADADGVHLGQNDLPVEKAYRLQHKPMIIGKSTHSIEQLKAAVSEPITYAALGPVFATPTKPTAEAVGLGYVTEGLKVLDRTGIGHAAIGGINIDNVEQLLRAGAKTIAVCRAVTAARDAACACRELKQKIVEFKSADL